MLLALVCTVVAYHPSETMGGESAALSFYATDMHYFCAALVNGVVQNNCAHSMDVVIHYSGDRASPRARRMPTEMRFNTGGRLLVRTIGHQKQISGFYKNSLDKFTAMHAIGYNYTVLIDADQLILRDMWYLINHHLFYELACVGFNLAKLDHIGTLPTLVITHNYAEIVDVPRLTRLKDMPDGNVFDDWMKRKQHNKLVLPAETMCYSYDKQSYCSGSYLLHFSHGGKPWAAGGSDISPRLRPVWKAFGNAVRQCVKGEYDLRQSALMDAMNSFADTHMHCSAGPEIKKARFDGL